MLIKDADSAMYRAKDLGRNNYQFYTQDMNTAVHELLQMEGQLRHALERSEFSLHYQPKIDIPTGRVVGVEALLRWQNPVLGSVSPAKFIPVLEDTGIIIAVGEWVLRTACTQAKSWQAMGLPLSVAVNLSARQFYQKDLALRIGEILSETTLAPEMLELEITESLLMKHSEASNTTLAELKARGIEISIDDFGTGYSSLSYLKRFPINTLKIDQSFVRDITTNPDDAAITTGIIALAHSLRLTVIAEGVETLEQLDFLRTHGCDQFQGYYMSRPLPPGKLEEWLKARSE
jgi:EAL domain-containing protein (putative c-di-GMP-specific phosphodiesterase class I)